MDSRQRDLEMQIEGTRESIERMKARIRQYEDDRTPGQENYSRAKADRFRGELIELNDQLSELLRKRDASPDAPYVRSPVRSKLEPASESHGCAKTLGCLILIAIIAFALGAFDSFR